MKKDIGSKKINNEQEINEGFSGENLPENYNQADAKLQAELETDKDGNTQTVHRARYVDSQNATGDTPSPNTSKQNQKTVENKDRNSDIAANRYPNDHPDNHEDRGNIKLKE